METTTSDNIKIDAIRTDGGTQARAGLDESKVQEYVEVMERDGVGNFPPLVVFHDGDTHWLADGFHRLAAMKLRKSFIFVRANVCQGTRRDAVLFACGANADHGLPRSADDKRRAVETLLSDREWGAWSDREIARRCKVSHTFVAKMRSDLTGNVASENSERTYTTKHGTTAVMQTAKIGNDTYDKSVMDDLARDWLAAYTDHLHRTWNDLEDNQIHHANSPCYQAFVAEFPKLTDPKLYLKRAMYRLRDEEKTAIIAANNEAFFEEYDRKVQQHREDVADPDGRKPPSKCPRCHAAKSSVLIGSDHWQCKNCNREYNHKGVMPTAGQLVAAEYTYTAEIEQYVEAVDAGASEPEYLPIWRLEDYVRAWLRRLDFTRNGYPITPAVYEVYLPDLAKNLRNSTHWRSFEEHLQLPDKWRKSDLVQAIHNVKEQLRQQAADTEGFEIQAAVDLLKRNQREIEQWAIAAKTARVAGLCAKAASEISHLVNQLTQLQKDHEEAKAA